MALSELSNKIYWDIYFIPYSSYVPNILTKIDERVKHNITPRTIFELQIIKEMDGLEN